MRLNGQNILLGGFHDHWTRADAENPTLLLAALNYYHYDFITLQDGPQYVPALQAAADAFSDRIRIHPGAERGYGWGHVVTVNPNGQPPPADDTDPVHVLSELKKTCDLVMLAHPDYGPTWEQLFKTGEMDRLIDEGIMDGIELINSDGFDAKQHRKLIEWYRARDQAGKRTPIIAGWDLHCVVPRGDEPPVLYSAEHPPCHHFESALGSRTIVFAEENSLPAICAAVKDCRTVIEDLATGELAGPAPLVEFLEKNGYREAIAELDAQRDAVSLTVPGTWIAGSAAALTVSQSGTVRIGENFREGTATKIIGGQSLDVASVPVPVERDMFYLPVAWQGTDGTERIWAVEATHPIQFEILPWMGEGGPAIELLPKLPFQGTISLEVDGLVPKLQREINGRTLIPVDPQSLSSQAVKYGFEARTATGISRSQAGFVTFAGAARFHDDWAAIPAVGVDKAEFGPRFLYGANRPWPGIETFSAQLQFAWTDADFLVRIAVRDPVHYQPYSGHFTYDGDCLQLALDPMLRRRDAIGNVYVFNLSLTKNGPELYRWLSPGGEAANDFTPPPGDVSLGDRYLTIDPIKDGLIYTLKLPWPELGPVKPAPGVRMGVYYLMFNNNGSGKIDAMHWPVPIQGMWTVPHRWGVLSLLKSTGIAHV